VDAWLQQLRRLVASGDWGCLKPYLRAAERTGDREEIWQARFNAGCCVGCGRKPCEHCGEKSPLFCEVCWKKIVDNRPPGMVVSGLAVVMQKLTGGKDV
jgi:hypothetical protein